MRRKVVYLSGAVVTVIVGVTLGWIWLFPPQVFHTISQDGYGGPAGFGGRGLGAAMTTWGSEHCSEIFEDQISYATSDDAIKDFDEEMKQAEIIEQKQQPTYRRIVGKFRRSGGSLVVFKIITWDGTKIHRIEASSTECALALEKSRLKF